MCMTVDAFVDCFVEMGVTFLGKVVIYYRFVYTNMGYFGKRKSSL
ncbi:MAG: hypothetical protein ACD_48C00097G0001 [uncultured bacterium]|nr:MAG: hypothetical protein ACD_48C00097G0001 [uncultured bacterium]